MASLTGRCEVPNVPRFPALEPPVAKKAARPLRLPEPRPPRPIDPAAFAVVEHRLPNGLKIRLIEDHRVPTISFYTFFRVGSRNERPGITGLAHLFEHMMFNGAEKYGPKEFDRVLEGKGGHSNAYTSNDITAYYEDFASDALETVIDLESDRMRSLAITPEMLASEREVVKEERRLRVDNDIPGMLDEALSAQLWKAHPYHWPVIGWMGDIDAITRDDALAFFRTYYAPTNATVVAVGDLDPERALALLEKAYGDIPPGPPVPEVVNAEPPPSGERRVEVVYPSQAPALMLGYLAPRARDPDTFVLDVIQTAISGGESSRLVKRLVHDEQTVTMVHVDFGWRIDPSAFIVFAEVKPGVDTRAVEASIYDELARVARDGLDEVELTRAKNVLRSHFLHEIATNNGRAHAVGSYEILLGDWREALRTPERYGAVTNDDVKRLAAQVFRRANRAVATLVPSAEEAEAEPAATAGRGRARARATRAAARGARGAAARAPATRAGAARARPAATRTAGAKPSTRAAGGKTAGKRAAGSRAGAEKSRGARAASARAPAAPRGAVKRGGAGARRVAEPAPRVAGRTRTAVTPSRKAPRKPAKPHTDRGSKKR
jgi:zinc protease